MNQEIASKTFVESELDFLWVELTQKCNLSCIHCYNNSGPRQELIGAMQYEDWLSVLEQSFNKGCLK